MGLAPADFGRVCQKKSWLLKEADILEKLQGQHGIPKYLCYARRYRSGLPAEKAPRACMPSIRNTYSLGTYVGLCDCLQQAPCCAGLGRVLFARISVVDTRSGIHSEHWTVLVMERLGTSMFELHRSVPASLTYPYGTLSAPLSTA